MSFQTPSFMIGFITVVAICFVIEAIVILLFGVFGHIRNSVFPHLQHKAIVLLLLSFLLQILFVLGFFFFEDSEIVEVFVEVVISISLLRFFRMIKVWGSIEAFAICHSVNPDFRNLIENNDYLGLYQEIKNTPIKDIVKEEVQTNCMAFILLQTKKIKPNRCCAHCVKDIEMKTKEEALKTYNFFYKVLLVFVIVIPICFLVLTITNRRAPNHKIAIKIISAIKGVVTIYCMLQLIKFVHSLQHSLPELSLLTKFFAVKLILLFTIIQTIVLNNVDTGNEDYNDEEMGNIINFFLLNIENCLLSFVWVFTYGYGGLRVQKLKSLFQKPGSNTELIKSDGNPIGANHNDNAAI